MGQAKNDCMKGGERTGIQLSVCTRSWLEALHLLSWLASPNSHGDKSGDISLMIQMRMRQLREVK